MREGKIFTRREFIKTAGIATAMLFIDKFEFPSLSWASTKKKNLKMIAVDYSKCTGCKTCEAVCSAYNNPVIVNGEKLPGLGNPKFSRICVHTFNPDVDVPNVCVMCPDLPCVNSCPVAPEPKTGKRAIYRDEKTLTIKTDMKRCIGCGNCAKTCAEKRTGIIEIDPNTGKPVGICNLCGGEPQCVKHCPFNALSVVDVNLNRKFYGQSPEKIAKTLAKQWYGVSSLGGVK